MGFHGYGDSTDIGLSNEPSARPYHDFGEKVVQLSGVSYNLMDHFCVLTESSRIYCWGYGADGGNLRASTNNIGLNEAVTDTPPLKIWDSANPIVSKVSSDNLIHWYDASDLSTVFSDSSCSTLANDGDGVGCLKDKAGSDHLIQATSANQPVIVYGGQKGKPVLKFWGNQLLRDAADSTAGFSGNQPYTIFMVVNVSYYNSEQLLIHYGDGTSDGDIRLVWDNPNDRISHSNYSRRIQYADLDKFTGQMTTLRFGHKGGANHPDNKYLAINGDPRFDVDSVDGGPIL